MEEKNTYDKKERGAVVVEATISLTAFIFAIFTILSIVNICYIQSRINLALNSASKDISQYSYLYYMLGLDDLQSDWYNDVSDESALARETVDGVAGLVNTLYDAEGQIESGDFEGLYNNIESSCTDVDSLVTQYGDKIADDPKQFIIGMAKMAGTELSEEAKVILGEVLAKAFMKKNLKSSTSESSDAYLRRYRVVDGLDGLDFNYSTLMAYGTTDKIQLVCTYDVSVIKFLNIDYKVTFRQCSQTIAWGNGISVIEGAEEPSTEAGDTYTVWSDMTPTQRGKYIVSEEKKNYTYTRTGSGYGFDAYNNSSGANEFISIISIDTHASSYSTTSKMCTKVNSAYSSMKSSVGTLDTTISMTKTVSGTSSVENVTSAKDSRTYKVIVVVPDDTDATTREAIVNNFETKYTDLVVEVKSGYGSPREEEETTEVETS